MDQEFNSIHTWIGVDEIRNGDESFYIINLMTITVERNLKVFHPYWSKTNLNHWMIYAAMVFAWIAGTLSIAPIIAHLDSSLC